ncbi:hypothetical protein Q3G72_011002 [Acer saccharum]|nr:hypothetical protein Q3G72_011002 [Acer saccharum]
MSKTQSFSVEESDNENLESSSVEESDNENSESSSVVENSMAPNIQAKRKVPEGEGDAEKLARASSTKQSSRKNNERFSTHSLLKVGYNTLNTKCTDFSSTAKHKAPKSSTFDTLWVASKLKFLVITSPPKSITLILAHLHLPAQLPKRMMIPVFQFTCPSLFSICLKLSMPMKNFLSSNKASDSAGHLGTE